MYVKLFSSILSSSIWSEAVGTRIAWITMLALADRDGFVRGAPSGLARQANISLADCQRALKVLESPDLESQSQEYGGRRIETMEGGWLILNYAKYRELRDPEQRREYMRDYMRKRRKQSVNSVSKSEHIAEAEADTDSSPSRDLDIENSVSLETSQLGVDGRKSNALVCIGGQPSTPRVSEGEALEYLREMVFAYWRAKLYAGNSRLGWTTQRRQKIDARLAFYNLDPNACLYAIYETSKDPHRMGENDRNRPFKDLPSIFVNDSVCDELANRNAHYAAGKPHPFIEKYVAKYPPPGVDG